MAQTPPENAAPTRRAGWFALDDRALSWSGVQLALLLVCVVAAGGWWTLRTEREAELRGRVRQVEAIGGLIAQAVEAASSDAQLTGLRRLMVDAAYCNGLRTCRVVLPDGSVLADAQASNITALRLPSAWPSASPVVTEAVGGVRVEGGVVRSSLPVVIAGRGRAAVLIEAPASTEESLAGETYVGLGGVGAGGFCGLLLVYRSMRRRWRGLSAMRSALRAWGAGERDPGLLRVGERFGVEAGVWNDLVAELEGLRVTGAGARGGAAEGAPEAGQLQAACDALWQGLLLVDSSGSVAYSNGAAAVLLRARREAAAGATVESLMGDEPAAAAIRAVATGESRQRTSLELRRAVEGGEGTVLRVTVKPVRREEGTAALVLIEDVTQQKVADDSRNAFVAQATHELRTPLTNMRLYVEAMLEEGETDAAARARCVNVTLQELRRLERIVADMLSVSEIEAGAMKLRVAEVRLDALFEELKGDYAAQAHDKEIELAFDLPPKFPSMHGDRDKLLLSLHNLIGNALKYTPPGGKVTVATRADGARLVVEVIDNGIGIKEEEQALVFERFYRAKDRRIAGITGSGIGLALARQVACLHGGDITLKSQLDKGSTFTLSVPLSQAAAPTRAAA